MDEHLRAPRRQDLRRRRVRCNLPSKILRLREGRRWRSTASDRRHQVDGKGDITGSNSRKSEDSDPDIPDGPAKALGKQEIAILVDALPLRRDAVQFDAIDKFILLYAPFAKNKALLRDARNAFRGARAQLSTEMAWVPVSNNPRDFVSLIKRPTKPSESHRGIAIAFVDWTIEGLSLTRAIIGDFAANVGNQLTKEQESKVFGQIGMGPGSSGIVQSTMGTFESLKEQIQKGH